MANFAKFFINRPVFAIVVSIFITLLGTIAIMVLPIAQYPQISLPTVRVSATYLGADSAVVEETVATPIEQQVNGVEGMLYMESNNGSDGTYSLTVTFELERDADIAAVQVQNRVSQATSQLPREVINTGVNTTKSMPDSLMYLAVYSPNSTRSGAFITNFCAINVLEPLKRVKGVGGIQQFSSEFGMRVWLDPDAMARLNLTINDIANAIQEQNVQAPAGQIGKNPTPEDQAFTYTVKVKGRLVTAEEFGNIVLRAKPDGSMAYLRDVARIELGDRNYDRYCTFDGKPATIMAVNLTSTASAVETADLMFKKVEELQATFPDDVAITVIGDNSEFIKQSLSEVVKTLLEAVVLVAIVMMLFLQSFRATLIPLIAVPVSLVGTFAFFTLFGFSINTLTMFGMVLAIGIVVDDAIVVIEAVEYNMEHHRVGAKQATVMAMDTVSSPVVAIALILIAVFVPVAFIGGITGQLYKQFAITVAVSVGLSALVALSLTPALCAMMLKPKKPTAKWNLLGRGFDLFNRGFSAMTRGYSRAVRSGIRYSAFVILFLGIICFFAYKLNNDLPSGFVPDEDQRFLLGRIELAEGASVNRTAEISEEIDLIIRDIPGVESTMLVVGMNVFTFTAESNYSFFGVKLEHWSQRTTPDLSAKAIQQEIVKRTAHIPEVSIIAMAPPTLPGLPLSQGLSLVVQDRAGNSPEELDRVAKDFAGQLMGLPEFSPQNNGVAYSLFNSSTPAFEIKVDREKVKKLDVPLSDVFLALQAFLGGYEVNDFNRFGRTYKVSLQAEGNQRTDIENIKKFYVRSTSGAMIPLGTLVTYEQTTSAASVKRYNAYRSAAVNASPATGYSSGQAMAAVEELAKTNLPEGYFYEWTGLSYQEKEAGGKTGIVFGLAIVFVFLFLAAQYESWSIPFAVMLAVPLGVFGAFMGQFIHGLQNDVYTQIGLILLIGLAAKNAILIVEYARQRRSHGIELSRATIDAATVRLRPILMTSFAFILGVLPLARATGAGAAARNTLGNAVVYGMTAATFFAIFVVPVLFYLIQKFSERFFGHKSVVEAPVNLPTKH